MNTPLVLFSMTLEGCKTVSMKMCSHAVSTYYNGPNLKGTYSSLGCTFNLEDQQGVKVHGAWIKLAKEKVQE